MGRNESVSLAIVGLVALTSACALIGPSAAMSIEKLDPQKPFKVTHKNSGPSYDTVLDLKNENDGEIGDQVDKKRVSSEPEQVGAVAGSARADDAQVPMGHVTIRRIFLVPVKARGSDDELERPESARQRAPLGPAFGAQPFWPLMGGIPAPSESEERPQRGHLLPLGESAWQRNKQAAERESAFDPIRMMLDLIDQAINERLAQPQPPALEPTDKVGQERDLNKDASNNSTTSETGLETESELPKRPLVQRNKPQSHNETSEEVVEIEGKKYLKKSLINRHVGENIVFMTRRLIFVPLNETDSSNTPTAEDTKSTASSKPELEPTTTTTTPKLELDAATDAQRKAQTTEPAPSSTVTNKEEAQPTTTTSTTTTTTTTTAGTPTQDQQSKQEGNNKSTA